MKCDQQNTFSATKKKLSDLEPPAVRLDTPYFRFSADFQRKNNFFWSTEIAYANTWNINSCHQDSTELASVILKDSNANAFRVRSTKYKSHYTSKMGSLLVQLRWNYDALSRYVLIEVMSSLEVYTHDRIIPILGEDLTSKHLNVVRRELEKKKILLDPELAFRLWILKEIRNDLVHDRSTVHTFPSDALASRIDKIMKQASKWSAEPDWERRQQAAYNEMVISTEYRGKKYDLPQLYFIAIYALSWSGVFVQHMESLLRAARYRNIKYRKS